MLLELAKPVALAPLANPVADAVFATNLREGSAS
jgi:hypothetical protein